MPETNKYFEDFINSSNIYIDTQKKNDFNAYLTDMLSTINNNSENTDDAKIITPKINSDLIKKLIIAYQSNKNIKLNTDVEENSGKISFTQDFGSKMNFNYIIESNGKYFVSISTKERKAKKGK